MQTQFTVELFRMGLAANNWDWHRFSLLFLSNLLYKFDVVVSDAKDLNIIIWLTYTYVFLWYVCKMGRVASDGLNCL